MSFLIIILFLLMPSYVSSAAREALLMCAESVIPSLFPFMAAAKCAVITRDIRENNPVFMLAAKIFNIPPSGVLSLIFGLICGYPIGAKTAFDLLREERISKRDAVRLACFTNNAGPAFVISVVGAGFLGSGFWGMIIYISHILGSLLVGLLIRGKGKEYTYIPSKEKGISLPDAVPKAIYDSALSVINVTAVIMFFASASAVLFRLIPAPITENPLARGLIAGFMEITSGIKLISAAPLPLPARLSIVTLLVSFSGISVIFQTKSFARGLNIKTTPCVLCKVLSAVISAVICYFLTIAILFFASES